jgi:hypothetical protein
MQLNEGKWEKVHIEEKNAKQPYTIRTATRKVNSQCSFHKTLILRINKNKLSRTLDKQF